MVRLILNLRATSTTTGRITVEADVRRRRSADCVSGPSGCVSSFDERLIRMERSSWLSETPASLPLGQRGDLAINSPERLG
jgi:hypothetical protein